MDSVFQTTIKQAELIDKLQERIRRLERWILLHDQEYEKEQEVDQITNDILEEHRSAGG